jgi:hypothetical protein
MGKFLGAAAKSRRIVFDSAALVEAAFVRTAAGNRRLRRGIG